MYSKVSDIEWESWRAVDRATLLFVIEEGRILLMRKTRGLGQGKINGPGGKIEPGESPLECAIRETEEELCIRAEGVEPAGRLRFQFIDGYSIDGYVFKATGFTGTPAETEEGIPLWFSLEEIPFEEMWADDRLWFPFLLTGEAFSGRFLFDGDRMLDAVIESD